MRQKIDVKIVERYLDGLLESFIIYRARWYNIRGKQYLKTLEKYYVVDIGMRYILLGTKRTDVGHILENVIYLELKRREYEVYVGKPDELEVDFDTGRRPGGGLRGHPPYQCTGLADRDDTMTGKASVGLVFRKQFFLLLKNCSWNADISYIWKERNCCFP